MGMGAAPIMTVTIEEDEVKKVVPERYEKLLKAIEQEDLTMDELASMPHFGKLHEDDEDVKESFQSLENLVNEFKEKTGLELELNYQDEEAGDRYDDICGRFWELYFADVFQETEETKKLKNNYGVKPEISLFTSFG